MPIVRFIPDRFKDGFKGISSFDDSEFKLLQDTLFSIAPVLSLRSLVESISKLVKQDFDNLLDVFISVGSLTPFLGEDNINEIAADISDLSIKDKIIDSKNKKTFEERLLFLLENKQIFYAARGQGLLTEYGNVFLDTRIVTDIRPIFNLNINDSPECGMIVHNLHIHYQSDSEADHKDIYIALDTDDIKMLRDTIDRAEKKENSLRQIFEKSGMTNIR